MKNKYGASAIVGDGGGFSQFVPIGEQGEQNAIDRKGDAILTPRQRLLKRAEMGRDFNKFTNASRKNTNPFGNAAAIRTKQIGADLVSIDDKIGWNSQNSADFNTYLASGGIVNGSGEQVDPTNSSSSGNNVTTPPPPPPPPPPPGYGAQGTQNAVYIGGGPPMSNGTGSARPTFSERTSKNIKEINKGDSINKILFKKK